MDVRYTAHPVERMMQRGVSPREVEALLADPDGVIRQSRDKAIAYKRIRGRRDNLLATVAVERGRSYEVITVLVNFQVDHENTS